MHKILTYSAVLVAILLFRVDEVAAFYQLVISEVGYVSILLLYLSGYLTFLLWKLYHDPLDKHLEYQIKIKSDLASKSGMLGTVIVLVQGVSMTNLAHAFNTTIWGISVALLSTWLMSEIFNNYNGIEHESIE